MRDPRLLWSGYLGRTLVAWCYRRYMVWETFGSHDGLDNGHTTVWSEVKVWEMVWTMVAVRSDQRAKLHCSLIIGRTKVWTRVALWTDQRAKSHYSLTISRTKVWTMVALWSDQRQLMVQFLGQLMVSLDISCPKIWPKTINWQYLFDCSFLSLFLTTQKKSCRHFTICQVFYQLVMS